MARPPARDDDWILVASNKLGKRPDIAVSLTDPQFQLEVITRFWGPVFAKELAPALRDVVKDLLTARNHWAHMSDDPAHGPARTPSGCTSWPATCSRASARRSPPEVEELHDRLRWESIHEAAEADERRRPHRRSCSASSDLEADRAELTRQLDAAREAAASQTGRTRAVARQLAELQTQYAAVVRPRRSSTSSIQVQLRGAPPAPATPSGSWPSWRAPAEAARRPCRSSRPRPQRAAGATPAEQLEDPLGQRRPPGSA